MSGSYRLQSFAAGLTVEKKTSTALSWLAPVAAAVITLALLNGLERTAGFGIAGIVGAAILIVVVVIVWLRRRQI